jgi:Fic family protein
MTTQWIWQQPDWPDFNWQAERLAPLLRECVQAQGQLMGMAGSVGNSLSAQTELDALLQNIVTSSAIEGEQLNVGSVRSSLARRLGLELPDGDKVSQRSEGLAQLMLDATRRFAEPLTLERLLEWHRWLFPDQESDFTARSMHVGALRGDEPMQVVSGRLDRPTVHFEAPPRQVSSGSSTGFLPGSRPASIKQRWIRCCGPASRISGLSRCIRLMTATDA